MAVVQFGVGEVSTEQPKHALAELIDDLVSNNVRAKEN